MFKRLDRSRFLISLLKRLSDIFAVKRGLPVILGLILLLIGLVFQVVNVFSPSEMVELLGVIFNGLGVLTAIIGFLLITPLGGR